jgi:membrane protease YdiL (CAAX protease family)
VTGAIVLGAIMQLVMYAVTKRGTIEAEAFVRYAIVATIAFYAVVSVIVLQRLHAGGVRLYWSDGNPVLGIATGLGVGLTLGLLAIGINSAISGHLATDPNATLLVSEGAAGYILATILITMVAAPLVEETLFRGLLAESLRPKGMATAIWVSALAFSAWHLNPSALRYYALMGALFGLLYWKRGLVCSMAAHASFNGVLTVIATFLALTPGHSVTMNGLTFKAPSGWHEASDSVPEGTGFAALQGPSHATLLVMSLPNPGGATTTNTLVRRIVAGDFDNALPSDANFGHSAPEEQHIPAGDIVTMQLTVDGHQGELVWLPSPTRLYVIVLGTGGSSKARHDFNDMLQTFKVS